MKSHLFLLFFLALATGGLSNTAGVSFPMAPSEYRPAHLPDSGKRFPVPFLTFYLGGSLVFINGNNQLSDLSENGTRYDFRDDLHFPLYKLVPRINVYVKIGESNRLMISLYNIRHSVNTTINRDLQVGETLFPANIPVRAKVSLRSLLLGYNYVFMKRERGDLGFMIGVSGIYFQNKIETRDYPVTFGIADNNWLVIPSIGLVSGMYIRPGIYLRGIVDYFSMGMKKYDFTIFNIKPTLEFYLYKNLGLAIRYHYSYNRISNIPWNDYHGEIKLHSHAFSLVACYRVFNKRDR